MWVIQNVGENDWAPKTIKIVCNDRKSQYYGQSKVILKSVFAGESTKISMNFKAPEKEGIYTTAFQIATNDNSENLGSL